MSSLSGVSGLLHSFRNLRIGVLGDHILDEYLTGRSARISPEAPVQVVDVSASEQRLGGASNVVKILSNLGARVSFYTVVGADDQGHVSRELLRSETNSLGGLVLESERRTTVKTRILSSGQQLMRLDRENLENITVQEEERLLKAMETDHSTHGLGALVISDYGKGVVSPGLCQRAIKWARSNNIPVIVDPKGRNWDKYSGATIVKPNFTELMAMTDLLDSPKGETQDEVVAIAAALAEKFNLSSLLVTLGARGMLFVGPQGFEHSLPTYARDVFDVTGAGDSVTGVLALGLALGAPMPEIMHLANGVAGIVVGRVGTCAPEAEEILAWFAGTGGSTRVMTEEQLEKKLLQLRSSGKSIVFTNGCFDLLHAGHFLFLEAAARLGDFTIVALNDDASVSRLKGPGRPLLDLETRMRLISALEWVDAVIAFSGDSPEELLRQIRPDVIVKGENYGESEVVGADMVRDSGGRVEIISMAQQLRGMDLSLLFRGPGGKSR